MERTLSVRAGVDFAKWRKRFEGLIGDFPEETNEGSALVIGERREQGVNAGEMFREHGLHETQTVGRKLDRDLAAIGGIRGAENHVGAF